MQRRTSDQFVACLLGGALGDALGWPVEFARIGEIRMKFGQNGIQNPIASDAGVFEITDDTQMTLFTGEGLIRAQMRHNARGICNPVAVVHRAYGRWLATQQDEYPGSFSGDECAGWLVLQGGLWARRAPGITCVTALQLSVNGEPAQNTSKGCGTVMKTAPIGLVCLDPIDMGCKVAALTHGHITGHISAGFLSRIIGLLLEGRTLAVAINESLDSISNMPGHEETTIAVKRALEVSQEKKITPELIETLGGGWVAEEALSISLLCALRAESFEHGVRLAVNHSGDSDSTGAIAGNLLGLLMGLHALPSEWIAQLECADVIRQIARDLFSAASGQVPVASSGDLDCDLSGSIAEIVVKAQGAIDSRSFAEWARMYPCD